MASVENRVVQMTFDNASFERKLGATLTSLEKLQKSLDFANASKGMRDLNTAGRNFNLSGLGASIDGISTKFLALSTIGITVLSNLANRAVDAGIAFAKNLTLDNVINGFREYELNIKSIQTILANTKADGTNLQDVNAALDELNTYADQTIYNFAEMTRNIGSFTAAGVELDVATRSIKGIANLAAISGSNSQQASTAMYQLSQAIATGSLKLMDWNSVVNAGMGGEVFQRALFETGKAMGTLVNVPVDQSFDAWKDAGNSFRGSLEQGWITADVLTQTLEGFTGELSEADLAAAGFGEDAIKQFLELGETGVEAATKVRTFTQLMDTMGEAIGSGWSQSFRTIIGDFEEATDLFTAISDKLGSIIGASADRRNDLLARWDILGGRTDVLDGLKAGFQALMAVVEPVSEAFRTIFPPMTAYRLAELSASFKEFMEGLIPGEITILRIKTIFTGLFAALEIGWNVLKETANLFGEVFQLLSGKIFGDGEGVVTFFYQLAETLTDLNRSLLAGGGLSQFFDEIYNSIYRFIEDPIAGLNRLKDAFIDFFKNLKTNIDIPEQFEAGFARLEQRFEGLKKLADKIGDIWGPVKDAFSRVGEVLEETWTVIRDWFSNLGSEMAKAAEPGDFDAVVDVVNVGLLGGIAALLGKLVSGGFKFDLGNGFFENAANALEEVGGVLKAMQADLKANALLKIAGAVGVLALSIGLLAMIDSAALTRALTAISVGLAQLVGTFAIFAKLAIGPTTTAKFAALGLGLALLAGALLLLSVSVKIMSTLSWEEIAKGLTAVTGLLVALSAAVIPLSANSGGMIRAGIGITALAIGLNLLALSMKIFATMSWEEIGKGLTGVAGGLTAIAAAMQAMPKKALVKAGVSILLISVALNALAGAVLIFATMSWEEMGQGLAGVAGGLLAIALAMQLMPATLPITAAGLVLVGAALVMITDSMKKLAELSWEEMGRGLAGLAGSLLILGLAMAAMSGALVGAIALTVAAAGLSLLAKVVKEFAGLSIKELAKGIGALAAVMVALALGALLIAPAIPAMLGVGAALLILGAGFALFGLGAQAVAKAFQIMAEASTAGSAALIEAMYAIGAALPYLIKGFAVGLVELIAVLLRALPVILEQLGVIFIQIIQTLRDLIPDFTLLMIDIIDALLKIITEKSPDIVAAGFQLLLDLLKGIRDNIQEITTLGIDIILNFIKGIEERIGDIIAAGLSLLRAFITGIIENIGEVVTMVTEVVAALITAFGDMHLDVLNAGVDMLVKFLEGITNNLSKVVTAVGEVVTTFIEEVAGLARDIIAAGAGMIIDLIEGIGSKALAIARAAGDTIIEFIRGVGDKLNDVIDAGVDTVLAFLEGVADNALEIANGAADVIIDFINGLADAIRNNNAELREAGKNLAGAIIDGMTFGLSSKANDVKNAAVDVAKGALSGAMSFLGINSPSKEFIKIGNGIVEGFALGMKDDRLSRNSAVEMAETATNSVRSALAKAKDLALSLGDVTPTITPVLDLTKVEQTAKNIGALLNADSKITSDLSYSRASSIAASEYGSSNDVETVASGPSEVKFEQIINAPTQLSTADIYRQTRNVITLAKEELSIP